MTPRTLKRCGFQEAMETSAADCRWARMKNGRSVMCRWFGLYRKHSARDYDSTWTS